MGLRLAEGELRVREWREVEHREILGQLLVGDG